MVTAKVRTWFKKDFEETGKAVVARVGVDFFHAQLDRMKDGRVKLRIELFVDDDKFEREDFIDLGEMASSDEICEHALRRIEAVMPKKKKAKKGA